MTILLMYVFVLPDEILAILTVPDWIIPTLIGIVASFWLGMRFRLRSQMAYQSHDFTVVGDPVVAALGNIRILFNDVEVPRVVVTQLAVWNTGNTVLRGKDIVESDPLTVCFGDGAVILHAQRMTATQQVNDFRIRISEHNTSRAFLDFDYLNGRDGAKFQIVHTGAKDKPKITGSIRGLPKGVENWGDLEEWSEHKSRLSNIGFLPIPLGVFLLGTWIKGRIAFHYPTLNKYTDWILEAVGVLIAISFVGVIVFVIGYSLHTRARATPKSLSLR